MKCAAGSDDAAQGGDGAVGSQAGARCADTGIVIALVDSGDKVEGSSRSNWNCWVT